MVDFGEIKNILTQTKHIVVVGLSANSSRASHWITVYLKDQGYEVTGVNPGLKPGFGHVIPGVKVVNRLSEVEGPFELVNVYRSPDAIPALVEELKAYQARTLWLQPGAENSEAEKRAQALGMRVISGRCIYQDHESLF